MVPAQSAGSDLTHNARAVPDDDADWRILFRDHVPDDAAGIEVYAQPASPDASRRRVRSRPVPVRTHRTEDRVRTYADPADMPKRFVREGGLVDFEVVARSDDRRSTWITARLVRVGSAFEWADPVTTSASVSGERARLTTPDGSTVAVPRIQSPGAITSRDAQGGCVSLARFSAPVQLSDIDASAGKASGPCRYPHWVYTKKYRTRPTTIGTSYPVAKDRARMVVSSSQGAHYGIATSTEGAYAAFHATGGRFVQSGWGFTWAWSKKKRSYRKGIRYRLMKLKCYGQPIGTMQWSWHPVGETGGTGTNRKGVHRPKRRRYCATVSRGVWRRNRSDGKYYSYGAAVKFASLIGIDLTIDRNYSHRQRLEYKLKRRRRLCGNNAYPATAGKIIDRRRRR